MIKFIYFGKKPADQSMAAFRAYYLDHHAPLFRTTVTQARKYTINFPIPRPGREPMYDFVTEIWWDDMDTVRAFYKSETYKTIIEPDELRLGVTGQGAYFEEFVQK
jgi:uncharacterized protein (TIGR02118 family)